MKTGIIGAGGMGRSIAAKLVQQGHTVSIANSRGPASLQQIARELGATATTVEGAVEDKELVIVSIPQKNITALPQKLFRQIPKEVIVIDTGNYYPGLRDGIIPSLEQSGIDSLWVQEQLGIPVIKLFNSILAESLRHMGKPKGNRDRIALAISGDDPKAKEILFQLVESFGFDPFDTGPLSQSWKQQPGSSIYCREITLEELSKRVAAMGSDEIGMRQQIIAKREADEMLMKADYPAYLKTLH